MYRKSILKEEGLGHLFKQEGEFMWTSSNYETMA